MKHIRETEYPDPRIEKTRINVSDVLFALSNDKPKEQLYEHWELQKVEVQAAVKYYKKNKNDFNDEKYYDKEVFEDAVREWEELNDLQ